MVCATTFNSFTHPSAATDLLYGVLTVVIIDFVTSIGIDLLTDRYVNKLVQ